MPPSKRKPRRSKATDLQPATSDVDMPDSSPTRPSAKKRKGNNGRATKRKTATPEPQPPKNDTDSADEDDQTIEASHNELMDKVISYLSVSKDPVQVARDHANEGAEPKQVSAYAKIAGRDWTFYVTDMVINIGRPPDERQMQSTLPGVSSPIQDLKEQFPVHIDLGPSKIVSRHHASIFYDADWPADGGWHIRVNGRNGVRVNNILLRRSSRQQIKSGAVIEVAGTQMMDVTVGDKVEIDPFFVDRAEIAENGVDIEALEAMSDQEDKPNVGNELPGYQSLAPAPPNFKRASTPPQQSGARSGQTVFDSKAGTSPMYGRGMMMESTQEIDYSRDSAKDLKPPYSYAHMIAQAIFSSDDQKLTLSNIYSFIADKYAFYRHSNSGWQNSIRHNLSLNKAFQKVPRRTDEPGKGMKWQIAPEYREEYWKKQQRRVGTSSNPSSPASSKDINPNFRGANGQNLGYDTTMVYQFPAKDGSGSGVPKLNMSFPPFPPNSNQPYPGSAQPASASQPGASATTPQRKRTNTADTHPLDDSPLPPNFPSSAPRPTTQPFYPLPANHSGGYGHQSPTNPTLSSSYLDTPFHPSHHNIITPAPLRQNPKLAPPSTLVAPSKFMPESSPAGPGLFWKGFLGGGMTPGPQSAIPPDMSPEKMAGDDRIRRLNALDHRDAMSSSPPPMDEEGALSGSPSKPARARSSTIVSAGGKGAGDAPSAQQQPLMPSNNGVPNLLSADARRSSSAVLAPSTGTGRLSVGPPTAGGQFFPPPHRADKKEGDSEGEDGFDLAKGFAPIGSSRPPPGGIRS